MKNDEQFVGVMSKLLKLNINQYLTIDDNVTNFLDSNEISLLLSFASVFSLSEDTSDISLTYEICSRLIESHGQGNPNVVSITDALLSRIGNFPGRSLLREKFLNNDEPPVPFAISIERIARTVENTVGESNALTDFQYKLYDSLERETSLSVSAPTSAGKSFILNLDLVRRLRHEINPCIVYIVPTRALVSEVVSRIRNTIRSEEIHEIIVRTAPFPITSLAPRRGVVYVLTQERLLSLLSISNGEISISLLIVDEAHELQKGKRGILLQNAIDLALKRCPNMAIFFASPLIKNPGYILEIFKRSSNGRFFTEEISPVSQNIILISEVAKKPQKVKIQLLTSRSNVDIGTSDIDFNFRESKIKQKANFAVQICKKNESVIIFADSAALAEESALFVADARIDIEQSDEIADFIDFIKKEIHPEYPLIACLKKGVGFHYGDMPSIVRNGVERLFRESKIHFLCCTSTLLQGVNLPAKHIVIENPYLGSNPMQRADFRNLAGRAGRLLKEFHGNIWCLRPSDWAVKSYQGENLQEIRSAMGALMDDGGSLINALTDNSVLDSDRELADAAFSRLYHEVVGQPEGELETYSNYKNEQNMEILQRNITHMTALKIDIPSDVIESHRSLRPDMLQKLYDAIKSVEDLREIILVNPFEKSGKGRMEIAISMINAAFEIKMHDKYRNWVCGLAHDWVWGKSIGELISQRIEYVRKKKSDTAASPTIRKLLNVIEKEIRYSLVKYFAAYEDLLKAALVERSGKDKVPAVAPYHIYLEFGSCDQVALSLMALGLSRFTAIKLKMAINWGEATEPEDYLARLAATKVTKLDLPILCKNEIFELLGLR
ncbi:MAG: DEAD/DEAH box helicase [Undibacterium sp.]|uniref:DEAD/DEAH box helicase n=1 Tax=Undibacterium sp. TaxID=1914977 RepID=UPI002716C388|nr:DEAD/DEAH box helicase [Undibacterium sp.]MDO8653309.1 DEAD/DEAH box helicase [Undibacterium sp.]